MRKVALALMVAGSIFLYSCVEVALVVGGAAVGGVVGYYAGKEGYKVKVEKEKE